MLTKKDKKFILKSINDALYQHEEEDHEMCYLADGYHTRHLSLRDVVIYMLDFLDLKIKHQGPRSWYKLAIHMKGGNTETNE